MKINYKPGMQFSVTFDSGVESDSLDIPAEGLALVCTPKGDKMVVAALANYEGPLASNKVYLLSAASTVVTGEVPSAEEFEEIEEEDDMEAIEDDIELDALLDDEEDEEDDDETEDGESEESEEGDEDEE